MNALARPLILSKDMSKDDMMCLRAGHVQLLPIRDQSGRAIVIAMPDKLHPKPYKHITNMVRAS